MTFDGITATTKLSKDQITAFDWNTLGDAHFEVYGVEDYLSDYGNKQVAGQINDNILSGDEKEFFISFSFPLSTGGEELLRFLRTLQKNCFYY